MLSVEAFSGQGSSTVQQLWVSSYPAGDFNRDDQTNRRDLFGMALGWFQTVHPGMMGTVASETFHLDNDGNERLDVQDLLTLSVR
jgi:hypothetical protein